MTESQPKSPRLPRSIWALGLVSMFMDVSSETIHGLLPAFFVSSLGASVTSMGLLEGLAEATALIVKIVSGPFSDWLGRRKPVTAFGYALSAVSKPLFALATSVGGVFTARLADRVGKGIRGAPRDALIADITPSELRGRAFGLRQSLDSIGAVIGPLLAIVLMWMTHNSFKTVFWLAAIPALAAVATFWFGVEEPQARESKASTSLSEMLNPRGFGRSFWLVALTGALFQLARFSEAFLILRAQDVGLAMAWTPMILIVMNLSYTLSSYPIGHLSDKIAREWFLLAGLIVLVTADLTLAAASGLSMVIIGTTLWGLHMGLTQGTLAALVADTCPKDRRGTAFGIFNLLSAIALLTASLVAGGVWDYLGPSYTFLVAAGFCTVSFAAVGLRLWATRRRQVPPL